MAHTLEQLSEDHLDNEAVAQLRAGDAAAFDHVVRRYTNTIYSLAMRVLESGLDAEEATQDIFLKAYRALDSFDNNRRLFPWLYSIAINHLRTLRRRRRSSRTIRTVELSPEVLATVPQRRDPGPEAVAIAAEAQKLLDEALHRLAPHHRRVFVLRQIEGLSTGQTALLLGLPENTVKTHLRRARTALQRMLAGELNSREMEG